MLVTIKEQRSGNIFMPSFSVSDGEVAVVYLPDARDVSGEARKMALDAILAATDTEVKTDAPFMYVEEPHQSLMGRLFKPVTVKDYIRKYASPANRLAASVYDAGDVYSDDKLSSLEGPERKLVALYTALSWSNRVIIDLSGLAPEGAARVFNVVKQYAAIGGAGIVLAYHDDFRNDCTTFVPVEVKVNTLKAV
ncbi:hypothetical protein MKQ70_23525 [Chitinophaga sedimenti]|uniref:hypothetical protein n=1 Tax=Chitinophaga sedimenti TaxID=2033606 RepID=UPI0020045500|nr:hypothetical protein [Chitinophaga sedimenti]MCK7557815.1 hypothetical protein [Chitinophaga sedimenti]